MYTPLWHLFQDSQTASDALIFEKNEYKIAKRGRNLGQRLLLNWKDLIVPEAEI